MRILWDLRLFSLGYGSRGIGTYVNRFTKAFMDHADDFEIVIWGRRGDLPEFLKEHEIIDYRQGSWKNDLIGIPALLVKNRIDLIHYWVACGPVWRIGLGIANVCRTVCTVYDMGVQYWDVPYLGAVRESVYWKTQKVLVRKINRVICISNATRSDLVKTIPSVGEKTEVLYVPFCTERVGCVSREPYFVTLGGSPHKNLGRVVEAFCRFRHEHTLYRLKICGQYDKCELPEGDLSGVDFVEMKRYPQLLKKASGLVYCSLYEGLGLPPLEAMEAGCPLLLSKIPALEETCAGAGVFVDPARVPDIQNGMMQIAGNVGFWSAMCAEGGQKYRQLSGVSVQRLADIYRKVGS
ncbi:MAG: glycosyltransferase [Chitinispirillaceae bacterium]